jgi:NADP-dependent 3-hydroxy acid dehydrogenase YdfG
MSPSAEQSAIMRADERVAILTGTSSGFGMLSAIELARKRYRVIATMRDPHNAAELRERG